MNKEQKILAVRTALIRNADTEGVVRLNDLATTEELNLLWHKATFRGLLQFIRLNEETWGGYYRSSRKIVGNPRAFKDVDRQTRWTEPKYYLRKEKRE